MRVTTGFVAVTATGEFLCLVGSRTHVGNRYELLPVDELEDATVQPYAGFGRQVVLPEGARWVPVTVRREVVLAGWGVA